eukprot:gene24455-biopygen22396
MGRSAHISVHIASCFARLRISQPSHRSGQIWADSGAHCGQMLVRIWADLGEHLGRSGQIWAGICPDLHQIGSKIWTDLPRTFLVHTRICPDRGQRGLEQIWADLPQYLPRSERRQYGQICPDICPDIWSGGTYPPSGQLKSRTAARWPRGSNRGAPPRAAAAAAAAAGSPRPVPPAGPQRRQWVTAARRPARGAPYAAEEVAEGTAAAAAAPAARTFVLCERMPLPLPPPFPPPLFLPLCAGYLPLRRNRTSPAPRPRHAPLNPKSQDMLITHATPQCAVRPDGRNGHARVRSASAAVIP